MKSTNVNLNRNEIWEMYQNVVKQTAKKFLGDKHLEWVDDITQDAIMKAILNQDKYDDQVASLNAWLYTLTKNLCLDFMGKKKNDPYSHFDVNEAIYLSVEESNELEQSEIEHQINTALSQLGERDRMLLKIFLLTIKNMLRNVILPLFYYSMKRMRYFLKGRQKRIVRLRKQKMLFKIFC